MTTTDTTKSEEIPLEDIDKLLEAEDPEFSKQLEDVKGVENDTSVVIEAAVSVETLTGEALPENKTDPWLTRMRSRLRTAIFNFKAALKAKAIAAAKASFIWLKTRPKEYLLWSLANIKRLIKLAGMPIAAFRRSETTVKLMVVLLMVLAAASVWILLANIKGVWIPQLNEQVIRSLEPFADHVYTVEQDDKGESFYSAFPQERHEYLFRRMKVNLKRTEDSPNPMGAFEIFVLVDSRDTAIEIHDRETELFDLLQRVLEDETFGDLETEFGKARLKGKIKRELNQKLTQGWIKDVSFKTFVLKP